MAVATLLRNESFISVEGSLVTVDKKGVGDLFLRPLKWCAQQENDLKKNHENLKKTSEIAQHIIFRILVKIAIAMAFIPAVLGSAYNSISDRHYSHHEAWHIESDAPLTRRYSQIGLYKLSKSSNAELQQSIQQELPKEISQVRVFHFGPPGEPERRWVEFNGFQMSDYFYKHLQNCFRAEAFEDPEVIKRLPMYLLGMKSEDPQEQSYLLRAQQIALKSRIILRVSPVMAEAELEIYQ